MEKQIVPSISLSDLDQICKCLNVYLVGSRLYDTHTDKSDFDFFGIVDLNIEDFGHLKHRLKEAKRSTTSPEDEEPEFDNFFYYRDAHFDLGLYRKDYWAHLLELQEPFAVMCQFLPPRAVWRENHRFPFAPRFQRLMHAALLQASKSTTLAKRFYAQDRVYQAKKKVFFLLVQLRLVTELIETGKMDGFQHQKDLHKAIMAPTHGASWKEMELWLKAHTEPLISRLQTLCFVPAANFYERQLQVPQAQASTSLTLCSATLQFVQNFGLDELDKQFSVQNFALSSNLHLLLARGLEAPQQTRIAAECAFGLLVEKFSKEETSTVHWKIIALGRLCVPDYEAFLGTPNPAPYLTLAHTWKREEVYLHEDLEGAIVTMYFHPDSGWAIYSNHPQWIEKREASSIHHSFWKYFNFNENQYQNNINQSNNNVNQSNNNVNQSNNNVNQSKNNNNQNNNLNNQNNNLNKSNNINKSNNNINKSNNNNQRNNNNQNCKDFKNNNQNKFKIPSEEEKNKIFVFRLVEADLLNFNLQCDPQLVLMLVRNMESMNEDVDLVHYSNLYGFQTLPNLIEQIAQETRDEISLCDIQATADKMRLPEHKGLELVLPKQQLRIGVPSLGFYHLQQLFTTNLEMLRPHHFLFFALVQPLWGTMPETLFPQGKYNIYLRAKVLLDSHIQQIEELFRTIDDPTPLKVKQISSSQKLVPRPYAVLLVQLAHFVANGEQEKEIKNHPNFGIWLWVINSLSLNTLEQFRSIFRLFLPLLKLEQLPKINRDPK